MGHTSTVDCASIEECASIETNKHFEDLIDPWYVICEGIPQTQDQLYADAVNAARLDEQRSVLAALIPTRIAAVPPAAE